MTRTTTPARPSLQALAADHLPEVSAHPAIVLDAALAMLNARSDLDGYDAVEVATLCMRIKELEAVASLLLQSFDTDTDDVVQWGAIQWDELEEAHGLATRLLA